MPKRAGKPKTQPPADDDPAFFRTCNRCGQVRRWREAFCLCGCPEFRVRKEEPDDDR